MELRKNYPLKKLNTFRLDVTAKLFTDIVSENEVRTAIFADEFKKTQKFILGGGSNILFTKNVEGLCLRNCIKGITVVKESKTDAYVKAGGGVIWHDLVLYAIANNLGGIENLSLIPGTVGAAPMQNIGAYGVELKETFHEVEFIEMAAGVKRVYGIDQCQFGYRDSIFKRDLKGKVFITNVTLRLSKKPKFNTSYGAIEEELKAMQVKDLSIKAISDAVINIRRRKLPDPAVIGNAGSFFKNPTIPKKEFDALKKTHKGIVGYPVENKGEPQVKLAAGWLIEQCGWKGLKEGHVGMHKDQALVLVNYGKATGQELYEFAQKVQASVVEKFGIHLEMEVNVY
jgi:UDP-N-acetylmuramate dehydrogenase